MNQLIKQFCVAVTFTCIIFNSTAQDKNQYAAEVSTAQGKWSFSLFPGNIVKATFLAKGSERNEQISDAVTAQPVNSGFTITSLQPWLISWPTGVSAEISDTSIRFAQNGKTTALLQSAFYSSESRGFRFKLGRNEQIFGTGERSVPINRRGFNLPLYNAPAYGYSLNATSLNYSVPFILSGNGYAIFFDNPSRGYIDIGKINPDVLEFSATSGELSFYVIPGENCKSALLNYHTLVGTAPLPPRWAMGNLMSRFGYRDETQVKKILKNMKDANVPVDAVIFDLFWFGDSIKNTLGNLTWTNKAAWPDPQKMISDFKAQGVKTILITEPYVLQPSSNYESSRHLHATDSIGQPYVLQEFYFGKGGIIDIFRKDAQRWFYEKYKTQMKLGVTGWWGDLGEPETHPANVYHNLKDLGFQQKFSAGEVHNIYGHYWSKMLAENFKKDYPSKRLFHLNRSGYAGSPRYSSFPWSGDVSRSWDGLKAQLPLMQGMSLSGIPYIHSDAGGFAGGDGDAELYIRWLQFAAFTPIFRPHGTALGTLEPTVKNIPSEAALWPEPTLTLARAAIRCRYQWLAYNYNLAFLQTKSAKPLITPMFFLNEKDSNLFKATDQYMWGEEVMVVPITEKDQKRKTYYIPKGTWTKVTGNRTAITGPLWYTDSLIDISSIPVFAKEGSFIVFCDSMMANTEGYNRSTSPGKSFRQTVMYYPSSISSSYTLYEDDGEDANAIQTNQYELITFRSTGLKNSMMISITSNGGKYKGQKLTRDFQLVIPNLQSRPAQVVVNGKSVNPVWNSTDHALQIPLKFSHSDVKIFIKFK